MTLLEKKQEQARIDLQHLSTAEHEAFLREQDTHRKWLGTGPEAKDEARKAWDDAWDLWLKTGDLEAEAMRQYDLLF